MTAIQLGFIMFICLVAGGLFLVLLGPPMGIFITLMEAVFLAGFAAGMVVQRAWGPGKM